jgi:predicted AAA+ superfamily ATPase
MIARPEQLKTLRDRLRRSPVVLLLGPRQIGKSTLARMLARDWGGPAHFFDLEDPRDLRLLDDAMPALQRLRGLVVLDEVQLRPELFPVLRVLADRRPTHARFLVLGSAAPQLLRQGSESLAGRVLFHSLPGLALSEVGERKLDPLWIRGGFPRSFTARSDAESFEWRNAFVRTFLERDVPQLGVRVAAATLGRFWSMLAHVHGGTLNWSELGRSLGVADTTVRSYADLLQQTFMIRLLPPWHENISKRQVKAPKLFLRDSGILHTLLDLRDERAVRGHPRAGASWEGFCIEQLIEHLGADERECFFWATQQGAELDLLVVRGGRRLGFELKLSSAPALTPSMRISMADLSLDRLYVLHTGPHEWQLAKGIRAVPLRSFREAIEELG